MKTLEKLLKISLKEEKEKKEISSFISKEKKEILKNKRENIEKNLFSFSLFEKWRSKEENEEILKMIEEAKINRKQKREMILIVENDSFIKKEEIKNLINIKIIENLIEKKWNEEEKEISLSIEKDFTNYILSLKDKEEKIKEFNEYFLISNWLKRVKRIEEKNNKKYEEESEENIFWIKESKCKSEEKKLEKLSFKMFSELLKENEEEEFLKLENLINENEKEKSEHHKKIFNLKAKIKSIVKNIEEKEEEILKDFTSKIEEKTLILKKENQYKREIEKDIKLKNWKNNEVKLENQKAKIENIKKEVKELREKKEEVLKDQIEKEYKEEIEKIIELKSKIREMIKENKYKNDCFYKQLNELKEYFSDYKIIYKELQ